jgi:glutamate synthase domain-containing protein 1
MLKEGQTRIPSGCAITGVIDRTGKRMSGEGIIGSITTMHDRSNGLGGGFAAYGIYPDHADEYALHLFYDSDLIKDQCEAYLRDCFDISEHAPIPVKKTPRVPDGPLIHRYFAKPKIASAADEKADEAERVAKAVMHVNAAMDGAYVFSSGKNMGVFKAIGFPEDVGEYYRLGDYAAYCWTAHGRYPTNTPGWWGGAHPFALLDTSVVHNGEISSYDANRRTMEMYGYTCSLLTDTEVIAYMVDHLVRRMGMSHREAADVMASPFWSVIDAMPEKEKQYHTYLRKAFSSFLVTGPFSILVGFDGGLMALNDRLKLRSMVVAEKGDKFYVASEECAIRYLEPNVDSIRSPKGGEPIIVMLEGGTDHGR